MSATIEQTDWQPETNELYHDDTSRISRSMLKAFDESRLEYYETFVAKTRPKKPPTAAMFLGTCLHTAVLEPERWEAETIVVPKCDKRTKDGQAIWADVELRAAGKTIISEEIDNSVNRMRAALRKNSRVMQLLDDDGPREHTITWTDPATRLLCKSRRDKVTPDFLVDLKTAADVSPEGFAKAAANFGYARQHAFYCDGHKISLGQSVGMIFIAICPETCEIGLYDLDRAAIELGQRQNAASLDGLATCLITGDWQSPHEKQVQTLSLPRYAFYQSDWRE